ncbi:MAG: cytochrome ubiquinol oxidase subunit I [Candidatus Dormibacteria bacterium]
MNAPLGDLHVASPSFPLVGNIVPIALLFSLHVLVAEYSVGAIQIAVAVEWWGGRRNSVRALRYARALGTSYYLLFSVGATLALFAVVLLTGLWPRETGELFNVFAPLVGLAFGLFLILTPLLVWYRISFGKMSPGRHALLGAAVAFWQTLFVVLIVGIDTYLMTPRHAGLLAASLNAPYWPLLLHRLAGNLSWTALLLAAVAVFRLRGARQAAEREFQLWAARLNLRIGLLFALLMPVDGFILVEVLRHSQPGYFENLVGNNGLLMVVQELLVGVVLVGGNVALHAERPADSVGGDVLGWAATGLTVLGMVVAALPTVVLPAQASSARYLGLALASVATAAHLAVRRRITPRDEVRGIQLPRLGAQGRGALVTIGLVSMVTAVYMGYIKEHARGDYAFYGELRQSAARGNFNPPPSAYP